MAETPKRTFVKVIIWSKIAVSTTFLISYLNGNSANISGKVAITDMVSKMVLISIYERIWNKIEWEK